MRRLAPVMALLWLATVAASPTPTPTHTPTPTPNPTATPIVVTAPPPHGNANLGAAAGPVGVPALPHRPDPAAAARRRIGGLDLLHRARPPARRRAGWPRRPGEAGRPRCPARPGWPAGSLPPRPRPAVPARTAAARAVPA